MRLHRILRNVALTLLALAAVVYWGAPIALSAYAARKAPSVARIVPTDLKDLSISPAPGMKLSYLGYEFEVPWADLDVSKTRLYPLESSNKYGVILAFASGRRVYMNVAHAHSVADDFAKLDLRTPLAKFGAVSGAPALEYMRLAKFDSILATPTSDYQLVKNVYEFTPDNMHFWSLSPSVHERDTALLVIKSVMPAKAAESGIFRIQTQEFQGFQEGNPETHQSGLHVDLYSNEGGVDFVFLQHGAPDPTFVTQPEINRIIQSLHKAVPQPVAVSGRS